MGKAMLSTNSDWIRLSDATGLEEHEVTFAIKQLNIDLLHDTLMDVSDPDSPNRGKYLNHAEVNAITQNPEAVTAVESFLVANGVQFKQVDAHSNFIKATATVAKWEEMFNTDVHLVAAESNPSKSFLRAVTDVHLPEDIAKHVDGIFRLASLPGDMRPMPKLSPASNGTTNGASGEVTPAGLKSFYNVEGSGSSSQSQCVFESLSQSASPADLATFEKQFNLPSSAISKTIGGHVVSPCANLNDCAEANLDVQYMVAMAPDTPLTYWYTDNSFESWIEAVEASSNPPLVNSISYGSIEDQTPASTAKAFDTAAMKLGIQGVSVFVSSGDDGVANFQARSSKRNCGYHPSFATKSAIPSYQATAVSDYFKSSAGKGAKSGYANGRGYPDISMAGFNYEVVINANTYLVSGTSASSPVVAGFASLVNAKRGTPLGFINPTLYKAGSSSFNDITSGNNKCCAGSPGSQVCCTQGFTATAGWDPLTGLGSVDYPKFEALFTSSSIEV